MILLQNISKRYPGRPGVLSNLSLSLAESSMTFLTGHSGAGKTTLLKIISIIERPSSGQLVVDGQNVNQISGARIPFYRRKIGIVFQEHRLLHDRSVFDNIALPLIIAGYRHREISKRVRAALDKVGLLNHEQALPLALSSGEQQRVGIARAVVSKPKILLADEPTGNLDPDLSLEIMTLFAAFQQVGVTVLIATHNMELISHFKQPHIRLSQGQLVTV